MSGVTDSVFDEINGVRFIDFIVDEMQAEKEEKEISVNKLAREVIRALDFLWHEKVEYNGIKLQSVIEYYETFSVPVNKASFARLLQSADSFYTKLKFESRNKK